MKIKIEVDMTPQEMLELFEGNVESLQKAMINLFMQSVPKAGSTDSNVMEFWQTMAKQSQKMFEQYQKNFTDPK